ncbi:MAG: PPOX class F420-dependent oxidoreductase [Anaerolineae bacterium]|nr:PPOX class F420-dependent oxidoreductase [Anaerolineae bacterium]
MTEQFINQKYINVETFRKSGIGVRTPVWFAKDENAFYVWTEANSGKAKRIRRDGTVKITPSTASGEPVGEWVGAQATADSSPEALAYIIRLMKKKYGLAFFGFRLMGKLRKANYTAIKIELGN